MNILRYLCIFRPQGRRFNPATDFLSGFSFGTWAAVAAGTAAVVGAGTAAYGANKQAKANAAAQDANIAAQKEAERQNWLRYLMQRGIVPDSNTQTGEVPGMVAGGAMNTRLPLWANVVPGAVPGLQTNASQGINTPFLLKK